MITEKIARHSAIGLPWEVAFLSPAATTISHPVLPAVSMEDPGERIRKQAIDFRQGSKLPFTEGGTWGMSHNDAMPSACLHRLHCGDFGVLKIQQRTVSLDRTDACYGVVTAAIRAHVVRASSKINMDLLRRWHVQEKCSENQAPRM